MITYSTPYIPGLSSEHQAAVTRLVDKIQRKGHRNRLRRRYYDYKQGLKDLGIALPPTMRQVDAVLGWPAKAVDAMVRRTVLDTWTLPDGLSADEVGISRVAEDNRLDTELPAGLTSALMHSCAFGFVTVGVDEDDPDALLTIRSAEWATGTWDTRRRSLSEALSIISVDDNGVPDNMNLYLPNLVVMMRRDGAKWDLQQASHGLGMPVEPIPYKPLPPARPFGQSRISRPVMYLTDAAVRTFLRTEVAAEFYNSPQRYALGAEDDAFTDPDTGEKIPGWKIILGHHLTLSRDEDGNLPTVGQFTQQSMQPNESHFRMIAQAFAAETSLPLRSLGVVGDNPESADAIAEANKELELEIRHWQKSSVTPALQRLMTYALRITDDSPAARDVYRQMRPHWQRPDTISLTAAADAVTKLDSVNPGFGASEIGMEMAGLEPDQIARFQVEQRRTQSRASIAALTGAQAGPQPQPAAAPTTQDSGEDATDLKAKFDALGVAVRAGVDPEDAARRLGLEGVSFTGAVPVSLRMPEQDATSLEER